MGVAPGEVVIEQRCPRCGDAHGKPRSVGTGVEHSITHAGSLVGVAVSQGMPVGLDVEPADRSVPPAVERLALTAAERDELAAHRAPSVELLRYWVAKEAALKATGDGLMERPDRVVIGRLPPRSMRGAGRPVTARLTSRPAGSDAVELVELDAGPGFVAWVALLGKPLVVRQRSG